MTPTPPSPKVGLKAKPFTHCPKHGSFPHDVDVEVRNVFLLFKKDDIIELSPGNFLITESSAKVLCGHTCFVVVVNLHCLDFHELESNIFDCFLKFQSPDI